MTYATKRVAGEQDDDIRAGYGGRIERRCECGGFVRSTGHVGEPDRCDNPECQAATEGGAS